ncbi:MAG: type II-A CRISPR-associated protein Csn2 [Erysipelotrichales bacterium]
MILRILGFDMEVEIGEGVIPILTIKEKKLFRAVIESLIECKNAKETNDVVITDGLSEIDYKKETEIFLDCFTLDVNSKGVLTQLYKFIENTMNYEPDIINQIENDYLRIGNRIYNDYCDFDFNMTYHQKLYIPAILKALDFKIDDSENQGLLDRIYLLINVYAKLKINKVLIFVNLKNALNDTEVIELYKMINYKKLKSLFINSYNYGIIDGESHYLIDDDYSESILF